MYIPRVVTVWDRLARLQTAGTQSGCERLAPETLIVLDINPGQDHWRARRTSRITSLQDHRSAACPHVVTRRILRSVAPPQETALCKTSRTIRFQEGRQ